MKKIRKVRKARKVYGVSKGDSFLTLFYSYCIKAREIGDGDHGRKLSEFRTAFNRYILNKYGRQFYDEYCVFHMLNKDNKTLIRALDKKQTVFLNRDILELKLVKKEAAQKPITNEKEQAEKAKKAQPVIVQVAHTGQEEKEQAEKEEIVQPVIVQTTHTGPEKKEQAQEEEIVRPVIVPTVYTRPEKKEQSLSPVAPGQASPRPVQPVIRKNPFVDYTAGRIYDTLPSRNINYIPPSFSNRSFKITMKRLLDGSEFVVYHQGKDANEAMMLANRHSFDSARIIRVEEEKKQ